MEDRKEDRGVEDLKEDRVEDRVEDPRRNRILSHRRRRRRRRAPMTVLILTRPHRRALALMTTLGSQLRAGTA